MREHACSMSGANETDGFVISGLVHIIANMYDHLAAVEPGGDELSGPRMGLLIRLAEEERRGNTEGITPTTLSRHQHVSRNTISALLRGLEDQGLIERRLDSKDRRLFRIRITGDGKRMIRERAPAWIANANRLAENLSPEERNQLINLLSKLFVSIHDQVECMKEEKQEEGTKTLGR